MSRAATTCLPTTRETLKCELASELLRSAGTLRLRITGTSMVPIVWPGDILTVRGHDASEALPGDIVLFHRAGKLVAHRVVERTFRENEIQWVTRGDSVVDNDAPISGHELLGRVTAIERRSRRRILHRSLASRLISWILRSSHFCRRLVLFVGELGFGSR